MRKYYAEKTDLLQNIWHVLPNQRNILIVEVLNIKLVWCEGSTLLIAEGKNESQLMSVLCKLQSKGKNQHSSRLFLHSKRNRKAFRPA